MANEPSPQEVIAMEIINYSVGGSPAEQDNGFWFQSGSAAVG